MNNDFLPVCQGDLEKRGWKELDIILVTGDAYVDHPSYGAAIIGRVLESKGFRVGIIAQPDWKTKIDFLKLGRPRLFFGVTSGNVDSMVANYTANKLPRNTDDYSPIGLTKQRPDRALIIYTNRLKECFPDTFVVLGGIEASLRRFAHYDYWSDTVRRSILVDAKADILVYGMGEKQICEIARRLKRGEKSDFLNNIKGTVIVRKNINFLKDYEIIPAFEEIKQDKDKFNAAFKKIYAAGNPLKSKPLIQKHSDRFLIQLSPALPLTVEELDAVYQLPYIRNWHPSYDKYGGVKGFETVKFSIISHRGCVGECSFCSLSLHQGRLVQSRSETSIIQEAKVITSLKDFKGTIADVGGPTVNLYQASCCLWEKQGYCQDKKCLVPGKCSNLKIDYKKALELYRKISNLPKVKHMFLGSGFRYDLLNDESASKYLDELCCHYISGQMKVAPESVCDDVLEIMNKPGHSIYEKFLLKFQTVNKNNKDKKYLVNYFIASFPGMTLNHALDTALYFISRNFCPEQIQDFMPLPMTLAGCIYYTGKHPYIGKNIYVAKGLSERRMQRALLQYKNPKNKKLIIEALTKLGKLPLKNKFF